MPHKHKRRKLDDKSIYDLPPTSIAKSLPTRRDKRDHSAPNAAITKKRKPVINAAISKYSSDDTPRAFARLLAFQNEGKRLPSGLDDGTKSTKKGNRDRKDAGKPNASASKQRKPQPQPEIPKSDASNTVSTLPKILAGESLRNFSARVDATLPLTVSGASAASTRAISRSLGLKERKTRHEKRLQKMIADWRVEEARRKEKAREREEEAEVEEEEDSTKVEARKLEEEMRRARTMRKGKKLQGKKDKTASKNGDPNGDTDTDNDDDDPWRKLSSQKLATTKQKNLRDVVSAPPTLKVPGTKFKPVVENVPKKGRVKEDMASLRKREELARERERFLEGWRAMKGK